MTLTSLAILTAIKASEWNRYDGAPCEFDASRGYTPFYATAGTTGEFSAIDLRCEISYAHRPKGKRPGYPIEYRLVGTKEWFPTGFQAIMRYDASRDHTEDGDGWEFIPYRVTELSLTTLG